MKSSHLHRVLILALWLGFVSAYSLDTAMTPRHGGGQCEYGTEPGYWWASRYKTFSKSCKLKRLIDKHSPKEVQKNPVPPGYADKTHILLIGDSLDRNVVLALSEWSGLPAPDYTPVSYIKDGRPQKIGRSCIVNFHSHTFANLFIFAANNVRRHFGLWKEGIAAGMHNETFPRICQDGPKYLPYAPQQAPYLISVHSAYWEVARWERYNGHPGKHIVSLSPDYDKQTMTSVYSHFNTTVPMMEGDVPTYQHASSVRTGKPAYNGMTIRHPLKEEEPDYMKGLLNDLRDEMEALMDKVEKCYPDTEVYCWRTAPRVATDDRIHHFFQKRPHVIAGLNQLARFVAKQRGWCILDMDMMLQGHGNNEEYIPDGAHPAAWVNLEYANLILNVVNEHKLHHAHTGAVREEPSQETDEDPEVRKILRKAVREEQAYREDTQTHVIHDDDGRR